MVRIGFDTNLSVEHSYQNHEMRFAFLVHASRNQNEPNKSKIQGVPSSTGSERGPGWGRKGRVAYHGCDLALGFMAQRLAVSC